MGDCLPVSLAWFRWDFIELCCHNLSLKRTYVQVLISRLLSSIHSKNSSKFTSFRHHSPRKTLENPTPHDRQAQSRDRGGRCKLENEGSTSVFRWSTSGVSPWHCPLLVGRHNSQIEPSPLVRLSPCTVLGSVPLCSV